VRLDTVLLKDEEIARDPKYGKKQLLLTTVTWLLLLGLDNYHTDVN